MTVQLSRMGWWDCRVWWTPGSDYGDFVAWIGPFWLSVRWS